MSVFKPEAKEMMKVTVEPDPDHYGGSVKVNFQTQEYPYKWGEIMLSVTLTHSQTEQLIKDLKKQLLRWEYNNDPCPEWNPKYAEIFMEYQQKLAQEELDRVANRKKKKKGKQ